MRIAIFDNHRPKHIFENYLHWIQSVEPSVEFVKLSYHLANGAEIGNCDGLILTGGGDVHPKYYGMETRLAETEEVNEKRDEFEFEVIDHAVDAELPILGICRGMQMMNVYLGGTLVVDLQKDGFLDHTQKNGVENMHTVEVQQASLLSDSTGRDSLTINSIHHQAIQTLGKGLMASALSPDGVIEAAEWIMKDRMPFLLLVQWHPERMKDEQSPAARNIAERFIRAVQQQ
ncbi:MAG: gamma-glutamyl-gamma-aminobutyrate hydrolase family protein [Bacteroidota bacterium]